ncbi:hypothetical protein M493_08710 [Geobacillus genomosp. 3]|uniref:Uncharacterized protein n=1 Tax=Geobacillus genomosp. 3 TaxID=1921421 RepID=S5Z4Z2_GEOG3|nr:hypothetical protein M493_08710 [Geobacillus genomosp. 3]
MNFLPFHDKKERRPARRRMMAETAPADPFGHGSIRCLVVQAASFVR